MFGNCFGINLVGFDVVLQTDQITVGSTEGDVGQVEQDGKCGNQEWEILVLWLKKKMK